MTLTHTTSAIAIALVLSCVGAHAKAQDVAGLPEARALAQCLHEQDERIQHLTRLIEQADARSRAAGVAEDVRRDAVASIEALVDRVRQHAQLARRCVEHHVIPVRVDGVHVETAPSDPHHESLAGEHGTVHQVESDSRISSTVLVVRGERIDGDGSAPDENVRAAVRGASGALAQCYEAYTARATRRTGDVHLSFTTGGGGRVSRASIEQTGGFDPAMGQCVQRAARTIVVSGQRGRSVYSYVIRFGE